MVADHKFSGETLEFYRSAAKLNSDVRSDLDWTADVLRVRYCLCDPAPVGCEAASQFSEPEPPQ